MHVSRGREPVPSEARPDLRWHRTIAAAAVAIACFLAFLVVRPAPATGIPEMARAQTDPDGYRYMWVDPASGEPVRYACEPIHYVINPALAPAGGIDDVHTAFRETGVATGLRFVYDGTTDESFSEARAAYQPERYGDRWAPVLIAWMDRPPAPSATTDVSAVGRGGSTSRLNDEGQVVYVTGQAVFDATADFRSGFGGETWGQVILHEIGHIVGLDHMEDERSVMNPVIGLRAAAWGGGDRAGLWSLGIGSTCLRAPVPSP